MTDSLARRTRALIIVLVPLSLACALALGSVPIAPLHWADLLLGGGNPLEHTIVWDLRAPRALAAFVTGGLLALAGVLMQALLRNPLADPYLLGISGGASVGALTAMLWHGSLPPPLAALAGAITCASAVLLLGSRQLAFDPHRLTLAGLAIAAGAGALVSLILAVAPPGELPGMLFWLMGDLSNASPGVGSTAVLILAPAAAFVCADSLDLLALGEAKALSLGVAVRPLQWAMLVCAAVASATAVMLAGNLGFVGLAIPHLLRLGGLHAHRALVPFSVLAGGALVTLADTMARTVAAPAELPAGALLALVGVPVLLGLVMRRSR
jgi:iron complex transport system permease protein